jgi:hypothetical protein
MNSLIYFYLIIVPIQYSNPKILNNTKTYNRILVTFNTISPLRLAYSNIVNDGFYIVHHLFLIIPQILLQECCPLSIRSEIEKNFHQTAYPFHSLSKMKHIYYGRDFYENG